MFKHLLIIIVFPCFLSSQIPNASFENWTGSQPDGWTACRTQPYSPYNFETQVNTACQGNSALKSQAVLLTYTPTPLIKVSAVYSGNSSTNFYLPLGPKPSYLTGCYIFQNNSDYLSFKVNVKSGGSIIGSGSFTTAATTTAYTQFIANINYSSAALPDSFSIQLAINNSSPCTGNWSTQASQQSTYFMIDNLSFDVNTGSIENYLLNEIFISPNPASDKITNELPRSRAARYQNSLSC